MKSQPLSRAALAPRHDGGLQRIGLHLVEQDGLHPGVGQFPNRAVQGAVLTGGLAVGDDQQGLLAGHGLLMEMVQLTSAKQDAGGRVHHITHNKTS